MYSKDQEKFAYFVGIFVGIVGCAIIAAIYLGINIVYWGAATLVLCEIAIFYLYRDHVGFSYRQNRDERVDHTITYFTFFNVTLILLPLVGLLSVLNRQSWQLNLYPLLAETIIAGALVAIVGIAIIAKAKGQLGRNYSPCFDSLLPFNINAKGMYGRIRHPIYLGNFLRVIGYGIMCGSALVWVLAGVMIYYFNRSAKVEESALSQKFPEYREYMAKTGRYLPRIK